jgi:hypothetical protein
MSDYSPVVIDGVVVDPRHIGGVDSYLTFVHLLSGKSTNDAALDLLTQEVAALEDSIAGDALTSTANTWDLNQTFSEITYNQGYYDDLTVPISSIFPVGANPPTPVIFKNKETSGVGYAVTYNGTNQYGVLSDYAELDVDTAGDLSIETWFKPQDNQGTILYRDGYFSLRYSFGALIFQFEDSYQMYSNGAIVTNDWHHVVVSCEQSGSNTQVKVYVNVTETFNSLIWGSVFGTAGSDIYFARDGSSGSDYADMTQDTTVLYNVALTASQVAERYNSGNGTTSLPTGITEASDVIAKIPFNEGSGTTADNVSTLGAGNDVSLFNTPIWETSPIAGGSTTKGVLAYSFEPGKAQELFFTVQLPHTYKYETNLKPHFHFVTPDDGSGGQRVKWGLESTWAKIGSVFGDTDIVYTNSLFPDDTNYVADKHYLANAAELDGTGIDSVSSMLSCRIFRDPTDDFVGNAYLLEFDFHLLQDTPGTTGVYTK